MSEIEYEFFIYLLGFITPILAVVVFLGARELREVYFQYKWIKRSPELKTRQLKEVKNYG